MVEAATTRGVIEARGTLLVVIDAQRGFVDPEGSLARVLGLDEVRPSFAAMARLRASLTAAGEDRRVVFVRSEYRPGQFTAGQLDRPLTDLCVPGRNIDCEWASGLHVTPSSAVVTKHQADAVETPAFPEFLDQSIRRGTRQIVFAGFQFTTCVRASALSTVALVAAHGVGVGVAEALCGARASSYSTVHGGLSRMETVRRELHASGVAVLAPYLD